MKKSTIKFTVIIVLFFAIGLVQSLDKSFKLYIFDLLNNLFPKLNLSSLYEVNLSNYIAIVLLILGIYFGKDNLSTIFKKIKNSQIIHNFENSLKLKFKKLYFPLNGSLKNFEKVFIITTYLYVIWRMLSRNYAVYSFTGDAYLNTGRLYLNFSQLPVKPYEIISLHFIHRFIPIPSYESIFNFQLLVCILCFFGIFKYRSKLVAVIVFLSCSYFSGFVLMTNGELEATEILLFALLTIVFINFGKEINIPTYLVGFNWFVGFYYFSSGLNKLIDVGIDFIWTLNLDERRYVAALDSVDLSSRYAHKLFSEILIHPYLSDFFGLMTLVVELSFFLLFLNNKYSIFSLLGAIFLHTSVLLMAGINFTGNSIFLILSILLIMKINNIKLIKK